MLLFCLISVNLKPKRQFVSILQKASVINHNLEKKFRKLRSRVGANRRVAGENIKQYCMPSSAQRIPLYAASFRL